MILLYDIVYLMFALVSLPVLFLKKKLHGGFGMRMGFVPKTVAAALTGKKNIWFHAVSVGEVMAVTGLIEKVRAAFPGHRIVLSTVTPTGHQLASGKLKKDDLVIYAPLDLSWVARKFVRLIDPVVYVSAETEIWPNIFTALAAQGVPIIVVNGRISDGSFSGYKAARGLFAPVLRKVEAFCMQSPLDAQRIIALGAPEDSVSVVGNIKFDDLPDEKVSRAKDLGFKDDELLWIAGSTHPGEEAIVLDIYRKMVRDFPALRLVLAPRHIERAAEVEEIVRKFGSAPVRYSSLRRTPLPAGAVVVVDTIGHLRSLYGLAALVFVGKSLRGKGGQNVIEPAFFGKPVLVGPQVQNFRSVVELFHSAEAILQVKDERDLEDKVRYLLTHPDERARLGRLAKSVVHRYQGATSKMADVIVQHIPRVL